MKNPKISICVPFHWMDNWPIFLTRCLASIEMQSFTDYEVILVKHSTMPITSNRAIESAKGDLIKVLYLDDYFAHQHSLREIVDAFTPDTKWLVTSCVHDDGTGEAQNYHEPVYTDDIYTGNNGIGSPSVLTMSREGALLFDDTLSWLLDVDLYKRLHDLHGPPTILSVPNVVIGLHKGQTSNLMSDEDKRREGIYTIEKHNG